MCTRASTILIDQGPDLHEDCIPLGGGRPKRTESAIWVHQRSTTAGASASTTATTTASTPWPPLADDQSGFPWSPRSPPSTLQDRGDHRHCLRPHLPRERFPRKPRRERLRDDASIRGGGDDRGSRFDRARSRHPGSLDRTSAFTPCMAEGTQCHPGWQGVWAGLSIVMSALVACGRRWERDAPRPDPPVSGAEQDQAPAPERGLLSRR